MRSKLQNISRRKYLTLTGGATVGFLGLGNLLYSEYTEVHNNPTSRDMDIVGHRGAAGLEPQNTVAGIKTAAKYNVDGVELDVQQTSDGKLILFHDPVYDISTDGTGFVSEQPYSKVKQFSIGGEKIPTFENALTEITKHNLDLYLEIKDPNILTDCIEMIKDHNWSEKTTIISLDSSYIKNPAEDLDSAKIEFGLIQSTPQTKAVDIAVANGYDIVGTHYSPVREEKFIQTAHKNDLRAIIWNLFDTKASLYDSLTTDADILIANRPDLVSEILSENPN